MTPATSNSLHLSNQTGELARLSGFISEFCQKEELPADFDMALNLAAEEVFMNVVMHGYDQQGGGEIIFTLTREAYAVTLVAEDAARAFNPLELPEFDPATPIEQRSIGGLGIHLLRNLMSELTYHRVGGKNRLIMRKQITAPA